MHCNNSLYKYIIYLKKGVIWLLLKFVCSVVISPAGGATSIQVEVTIIIKCILWVKVNIHIVTTLHYSCAKGIEQFKKGEEHRGQARLN